MSHQSVGIVVLRVIIEPILQFIIDTVFTEGPNANDGRNLVRNVVGFTNGLANNVNSFRRRVTVERIKKDKTRVQVLARTNLDRFLRGAAVINKDDVILKRANLNRAPADSSSVEAWEST